jgi:hypothetical protein
MCDIEVLFNTVCFKFRLWLQEIIATMMGIQCMVTAKTSQQMSQESRVMSTYQRRCLLAVQGLIGGEAGDELEERCDLW